MNVNIYQATYVVENVTYTGKNRERRVVSIRTPQTTIAVACPKDEDVRRAVLEHLELGKGQELVIVGVVNGAREVRLPDFLFDEKLAEFAEQEKAKAEEAKKKAEEKPKT